MMQWVNDSSSKYGCRLVCFGPDIDQVMEEKYLEYFNGTCNIDHPALDIEQFIDKNLRKSNIEYDPEATDLPKNVLGETVFNPDGSRLIRISDDLFRQRHMTVARGRFHFTCAHEAFHALFHGPLFRKGGHLICFGSYIQEDAVEPEKIVGDFTEWQANRGAAALLMPQSIFKENVDRIKKLPYCSSQGILIQELATRFDVSKRSAQIRLQTLRMKASLLDDFVIENDGIDSYRDPRKK